MPGFAVDALLEAVRLVSVGSPGGVVWMMSFRILGPVEASVGERPLPVGGQRQLKLFAFLVLHANRAVSSDALIDEVWGSARSGADNRLQMAIARLRKEIDALEKAIASKEKQLADATFRSRAPEKIVRGMESTVTEQKAELDKLRKRLDGLEKAA